MAVDMKFSGQGQLKYRGVIYESQAALLTHLLNKIKKEKRSELEKNHDQTNLSSSEIF
jgi:hypothetical protein